MKPITIIFLLLTTIIACKKRDKEKPVLTLIGNVADTLFIGEAYYDKGASVEDNKDKPAEINVKVSGEINNNKAGIYVLKYSAQDAAKNRADTIFRTVLIRLKNSFLQNNYNTTETLNTSTKTYTTTINAIADQRHVSLQFILAGFNPIQLNGQLSDNTNQTITIPSQIINNKSYYGSGSIDEYGNTINLNYHKVELGTDSVYTLVLKRNS